MLVTIFQHRHQHEVTHKHEIVTKIISIDWFISDLTVTIRLSFPQPESTNYALSALNESEIEEFPQGPPLKFGSASFGGNSQNRMFF